MLLVAWLAVSAVALGEIVEGVVVDDKHQPLPYPYVRVEEKLAGVMGDSCGHFYISESRIRQSDTLLISSVGFESKRISVEDFIKSDGAVELTPSGDKAPIEYFIPSGEKYKRMIKGKKSNGGKVKSYLNNDMIGEFFGYEFHAPKNKKLVLEKVGFYYIDAPNQMTKMKFRINVYDMSQVKKSPTVDFKNVLSESIYIDYSYNESDNGKFVYDLPHPIVLPREAMVEIEFLENLGDESFWFKSNVIGKKNWARSLESGEWYKDPFATPFFVECIVIPAATTAK